MFFFFFPKSIQLLFQILVEILTFINCSYCNFFGKGAGAAYSCLQIAVHPFVFLSL